MGAALALIVGGSLGAALAAPATTQTTEPQVRKPAPKGAPPLQAIAGLQGFECASTLVYPAAPDHPHLLRASYAFPDRARWWLGTKDEKTLERQMHYRFGEQVYRIPPGRSESEECTDAERGEILLQMELRRALMLWPDGFDWTGEALERTARIEGLGVLHARLATPTDARPIEVGDRDSAGKPVDSFRSITWREADRRWWPATAELWHEGALAWKETVDRIDTKSRFIDAWFVPADRRDPGIQEPAAGSIREVEIPDICSLRVELPAGTTWDKALSEDSGLRVGWAERIKASGLELDRSATFELSAEVRPIACLLRLSSVPASTPEGFARIRARKGLAMSLAGREQANPARMEELSRGLPKGAKPQPAYLRFDPRDPAHARALLILPYTLPD